MHRGWFVACSLCICIGFAFCDASFVDVFVVALGVTVVLGLKNGRNNRFNKFPLGNAGCCFCVRVTS